MIGIDPIEKECSHLMAIDLLKLGENIKKLPDNISYENCKVCNKNVTDGWICLTCFNVGCGRYSSKHAQLHYEQNKEHSAAIYLMCKFVYCYTCDKTFENTALCQKIARLFSKTGKEAPQLDCTPIKMIEEKPIKKEEAKKAIVKEEAKQIPKSANVGEKKKKTEISIAYYPRGLNNLGNTCFFNSSMQLMNASDVFVRSIVTEAFKNSDLNSDLQQFFKSMRSSTGSSVFDPSSFHSSVRHATRKFLSYSQEDSHDLILSILDSCIEQEKAALFSKEERRKLHTFLKTRVGSTIAFYLVGQVICDTCKSENWVFDPCLDLTLPLKYSELEERTDTESSGITTIVDLPEGAARKPAKQSILYKHNRGLGDKELTCVQDYIQQFLAQEKLYDKSNMFHCPKCKKDVKSMHEFYLLDPPDCLFVTLKRFKRDGFYVTKYSKQVENNLVIDLTDYIIQTDPNHIEECKYQLVGYTSHGGSLCGGHYTANVCNNGKWHYFSDSHHSNITEKDALRSESYVCLYERIKP